MLLNAKSRHVLRQKESNIVEDAVNLCLETKRVKYCGRCSEFPCKLIKKHDKNNQKRNQFSTLENAKRIQNTGINKIMAQDAEEWSCDCGGVISIQKRVCSECQKPKEDGSIN